MKQLQSIGDDDLYQECKRRGWKVKRKPNFKTAQDLLHHLNTKYGKDIKEGPTFKKYLGILVTNWGNKVSNEDIISHTWPTTVHEDSLGNLRVNNVRLRKLLADTPFVLETVFNDGLVLKEK